MPLGEDDLGLYGFLPADKGLALGLSPDAVRNSSEDDEDAQIAQLVDGVRVHETRKKRGKENANRHDDREDYSTKIFYRV